MRLMELICPGCGAQLVLEPAAKTAHCDFCGKNLLLVEDNVKLTVESLTASRDTAPQGTGDNTEIVNGHVKEKKDLSEEELEAVRKARLRKAMIESDRRRGITWTEDRADFDAISRVAWAREPEPEYGSRYFTYEDEKKVLIDLILDVFSLCIFSKTDEYADEYQEGVQKSIFTRNFFKD